MRYLPPHHRRHARARLRHPLLGTDATLGLALASTGWLYPFFGTMLGWLGVALTGSDTASNVLFGGLQRITAEQLGLNPILMAAANSWGGVMGKMIDAQSIVVARTATRWYGQEGAILRFVFFHSIALAVLVGILVMAQAYVYPFTLLVPARGALKGGGAAASSGAKKEGSRTDWRSRSLRPGLLQQLRLLEHGLRGLLLLVGRVAVLAEDALRRSRAAWRGRSP